MSMELKGRVLAAAAAEASPTRAAVKRRNLAIAVVAAASGFAAFVTFARLMSEGELLRLGGEIALQQRSERSIWLVVTTAGGALGIAASALWLALGRGGSMLGRSRRGLIYGGVLVPIGLLAWKVGCSLAFGAEMGAWPERSGLRCLALALLVALGPLLSFIALRRHAPVQPGLNGAAMGLAAGACAWLAVDLWCPVAHVPHVLLGHFLPLVLLAAAGAWLGQALLRGWRNRAGHATGGRSTGEGQPEGAMGASSNPMRR